MEKRAKSKKKRTKKEMTAIIIVCIIILTLLSSVIGFLVSAGYAANIKRFFSDLNPFKSAEDKNETSGEAGTEPPANKTPGQLGGTSETSTSSPATTEEEEEEQPDGTGRLDIINYVNEGDFNKGNHQTQHSTSGTEGYGPYDRDYLTPRWNHAGLTTKIISRIPSYELMKDVSPLYSTTTLTLELSLHSQDGSDIVVSEVENELRLSFPKADWDFGSQNIYLQQYNPNASSSYTLYNIKTLISDGNGVGTIELANLSGTYQSQNPYAYFRLSFG
ncbi:MAG: hypothetical protein Q8N63_01240 [Nanoarchaeota archaeon]|nr:hypothetical protein [Nanoarchaeota archaeon]